MIALDWPPRELHPNARVHHMAKAKAVKGYRYASWVIALRDGPEMPLERPVAMEIDFHPPDRRKRDVDGCLSAVKAGLDGISDAYGLNDYDLNPITIKRCDPVKGGRVIVRFS